MTNLPITCKITFHQTFCKTLLHYKQDGNFIKKFANQNENKKNKWKKTIFYKPQNSLQNLALQCVCCGHFLYSSSKYNIRHMNDKNGWKFCQKLLLTKFKSTNILTQKSCKSSIVVNSNQLHILWVKF
jgi:uncharacterized C2H2 Zn-finger protein